MHVVHIMSEEGCQKYKVESLLINLSQDHLRLESMNLLPGILSAWFVSIS